MKYKCKNYRNIAVNRCHIPNAADYLPSICNCFNAVVLIISVASVTRGRGRTAPGDTLQGG